MMIDKNKLLAWIERKYPTEFGFFNADIEAGLLNELKEAIKSGELEKTRIDEAESRIKRNYGCSFSEFVEINGGYSPRSVIAKRYLQKKCTAKGRGINWELTFPEWFEIWQKNGKLSWIEGEPSYVKAHHYCMARIDFSKGFTKDNVHICKLEQARSNSHRYRRKRSETKV